ncbi:lysophospholipid acyltransferase family protein [Pectinatus haikarae]|uniref:lysophospholipid acyltransferase family protein n=1 Tax=Pectinatus haikarae TaxID=349096 RepID=UPI0022AAA55B|nr:lysophospholipid acyltransferase family protein [Pectinatus haikarae]
MKLFSKLFCLLPEKISYLIGRAIGHITWFLIPPKRKNMAVRNAVLSLNISHKKAVQIVKKSWTKFGPMIIDVLRFPIMKYNMNKYITLSGTENLDEALKLGRGGILAAAHSGNWELLGGALSQNGYKLVGVAQEQSNRGADRFMNEYRALIGVYVMYKYDVRNMFKMISKGWLIGLIMDQDAAEDGIVMPFLGRDASCAHGAATIARRNNAPIIPVFIVKGPGLTHQIIIHKPIFVAKTQNKHEDIRTATMIITKQIEDHIIKHPAEWFWLHNRWKSVERHRATKTYTEKGK